MYNVDKFLLLIKMRGISNEIPSLANQTSLRYGLLIKYNLDINE